MVVRLPEECGRSRWTRAISLTEAADQTLPGHLKKRGMPSDARAQELTFDYDFKNLKRSSSKIAFRTDQANLGNYWANVADFPAKRDKTVVDYCEREELREFFANHTDGSGLHGKFRTNYILTGTTSAGMATMQATPLNVSRRILSRIRAHPANNQQRQLVGHPMSPLPTTAMVCTESLCVNTTALSIQPLQTSTPSAR